jgi:serine/threonine protein kinase
MDKNIKNNLNVIKSHNLFSKNFLKNSVLISASLNYIPEELPKLDETKYSLNEGSFINEGIKIEKYLFSGNRSKFYLAFIKEINSYILIKSFQIDLDDANIENIIENLLNDINKIQGFSDNNILCYFDVDIDYSKSNGRILMDYFPNSISLENYFHNYNRLNSKTKGFTFNVIKNILKKILSGLMYLHKNDIIHKNLNLKNILISNDNNYEIKIINYSLNTYNHDLQKYPYYSSPEILFSKKYTYETDIWSLGCILFELMCGYKPYNDLDPFNTICTLAQYINPIEEANDDIKDLFYDRKNRNVLDFLHKCFRINEGTRPTTEELINYKMFN